MPAIYKRTASMEAMAGMVAKGEGLAMVTGWAARDICERFSDLATRQLTPQGLSCQWGVVQAIGVSADHPSSVVAHRLVSWLAETTQVS